MIDGWKVLAVGASKEILKKVTRSVRGGPLGRGGIKQEQLPSITRKSIRVKPPGLTAGDFSRNRLPLTLGTGG